MPPSVFPLGNGGLPHQAALHPACTANANERPVDLRCRGAKRASRGDVGAKARHCCGCQMNDDQPNFGGFGGRRCTLKIGCCQASRCRCWAAQASRANDMARSSCCPAGHL
jgi:hypothetical protein